MSKKIAVILSGCGVYDGSEIYEATLSLLALNQIGAEVQCFAPDIPQMHVLNHKTGEEMGESRNVLVESSRLARGNIMDLKLFNETDFDAVFLPGGFGAAKNLSTFAKDGAECTINADVERALTTAHNAGKPIAALCISPVILAKLFQGARLTLGGEGDASKAAEAGMGARHVVTTHGEVVVDEDLKLITSPCYMLDATISQIHDGAQATVKALMERI